jgi:flagellar motor switch protein FliN
VKAGEIAIVEADQAVAVQKGPSNGGEPKSSGVIKDMLFDHITVKLTAILGEGELPVASLLELEPGSVVPLKTPLNGRVKIFVNDVAVAAGDVVAVGDQFGVRITDVGVL